MEPLAVEDIKTLLLNMHHLINSFRSHHAREEVVASLQAQVVAKQRLLNELDVACGQASWEIGVPEDEHLGDNGDSARCGDLPPVDPCVVAPPVSSLDVSSPRAANLRQLLATMDEIPY